MGLISIGLIASSTGCVVLSPQSSTIATAQALERVTGKIGRIDAHAGSAKRLNAALDCVRRSRCQTPERPAATPRPI